MFLSFPKIQSAIELAASRSYYLYYQDGEGSSEVDQPQTPYSKQNFQL